MTAVVGLDLSLAATGMAGPHPVALQTFTFPYRGEMRLAAIRDTIANHGATTAELVVLEDLPVGLRNAAAGTLGMLHGVVRVALWEADVPVALVPPASLKKYATGRGNATKADMRVELLKRTGLDLRDDNQVDAWWLRAMGLDRLGCPPVDLPATHRAALERIDWPAARAAAA